MSFNAYFSYMSDFTSRYNDWKVSFFTGVVLVLLGILIFIYPKLIVALISGTIIVMGIVLIGLSFKTREDKDSDHYYFME